MAFLKGRKFPRKVAFDRGSPRSKMEVRNNLVGQNLFPGLGHGKGSGNEFEYGRNRLNAPYQARVLSTIVLSKATYADGILHESLLLTMMGIW